MNMVTAAFSAALALTASAFGQENTRKGENFGRFNSSVLARATGEPMDTGMWVWGHESRIQRPTGKWLVLMESGAQEQIWSKLPEQVTMGTNGLWYIGYVDCSIDPSICNRFRFSRSPSVYALVGSTYYEYAGPLSRGNIENFLYEYDSVQKGQRLAPQDGPITRLYGFFTRRFSFA